MSQKKNISKRIMSCILAGMCVLFSESTVLAADESVLMFQEEIYSGTNLPQEFDANISFSEIETDIKNFIADQGMDIEVGTKAYLDLMYSFLYAEVENITDLTERYFSAYASVYVSKAQEIDSEMNSQLRQVAPDNYNIELGGTIQESKQQNIMYQEQMSSEAQVSPQLTQASYSVSRAQQYAATYALSWNPVFGRFASDCTNFASQIVNYAGMPLVAGQWQWNGNEAAKRTWNVAHDFTTYWSITRGYNGGGYSSRASVNTNANPGDYIAYMSNDTYQIWHVAFVQSKAGGNIYISQHTADRYNNKWNDISITPASTYIIVKFS